MVGVVRAVVGVVRAVVGVVRAVVGVMRAVVVMVRTVIVVIDVRHVLVRQAGGLHRGDEPISGDRLPIDVHALHLGGHMLSLLRLALGPYR